MSYFFAYLARMEFIQRCTLMRNTHPENSQEHSLQVVMIAHGLALIKNRLFKRKVSPEQTAALALFHDAGEVITEIWRRPLNTLTPRSNTAMVK